LQQIGKSDLNNNNIYERVNAICFSTRIKKQRRRLMVTSRPFVGQIAIF